MGFNLWWARNDGIGGHAWLSADDMRALTIEMLAQGMAWTTERDRIGAHEIEETLQAASPEPQTSVDRNLWRDWLAFLDGARENGGVVIR